MLSATEIASLREFSTHEHPVVSLYLDVDGSRYPRRSDYEAEFSFLVHDARRQATDTLGLSHDEADGLDSELQQLGEFLTLHFERDNARGLVIFSCRQEGLWRVEPLEEPVPSSLIIDWKPRLAPLVENLSGFEHYVILVVNKQLARIFESCQGDIIERSEVFDQVLKHHEQGGWEQNKLQRRADQQVHNHLKKAAQVAFDLLMTEGFDRFAVGISDELWPELDAVLHPYLKERLTGRLQVEPSAKLNEIHALLLGLEEAERNERNDVLLESLAPELSAGKSWVGGLDDVIAMLNDRRVDMVITEKGFHAPGHICQACGTLSHAEETCPGCRLQTPEVADIVGEAEEMAVRQDAEIVTVDPGNEALEKAGRIAAHLRY